MSESDQRASGLAKAERIKDPRRLRARLVQQAAAIISERGLARVTVDGVARAAGVTKGGLFHHFPSREALVDAVVDSLIGDAEITVDQMMADDRDPHGRFTRALLRGVLCSRENDAEISVAAVPSRALCLAILADPMLQRRWTDWVTDRVARHADTDDNVLCAIVRLAGDGIWLSSLRGPTAASAVASPIISKLIEMTYREC